MVGCNTPGPNVPAVPNQPATPTHSVRVPEDLWQAALRVAHDRGETVADVIRRALERYVRAHPSSDG